MEGNLRVDGITKDTETLVELFLDNYAERSQRTYVNAIRRLREMTGKKDFTELNFSDYCNAVKDNEGTNEKCLKSFFQFIYCNNFIKDESGFDSCYWDKDNYKANKQKGNNSPIVYLPALSTDKIEKLVAFMEQVSEDDLENMRLAFCFYILYFEGIEVNELKSIDANNFNDGEIAIADSVYLLPTKYWPLFEYLKSRNSSKFTTAHLYIAALGNKLEIPNLVPKQIKAAHDQNLLQCPQCGRKFLSFTEQWRSVNGKLMCADCAHTLLKENDVKKNFVVGEISNIDMDILSTTDKKNIEHVVSTFEILQDKLQFPTNYEELNEYLSEIGKLGEKYVYEQEKQKLKDIGSDYWELVDATPANDHNNGYDILSFTPDGEKIFIEVKTTTGEYNEPFYMSNNERQKANEIWGKGGNYQIHRVSHITDKRLISIAIYKSLDEENFNFEEIVYRITPKQ